MNARGPLLTWSLADGTKAASTGSPSSSAAAFAAATSPLSASASAASPARPLPAGPLPDFPLAHCFCDTAGATHCASASARGSDSYSSCDARATAPPESGSPATCTRRVSGGSEMGGHPCTAVLLHMAHPRVCGVRQERLWALHLTAPPHADAAALSAAATALAEDSRAAVSSATFAHASSAEPPASGAPSATAGASMACRGAESARHACPKRIAQLQGHVLPGHPLSARVGPAP